MSGLPQNRSNVEIGWQEVYWGVHWGSTPGKEWRKQDWAEGVEL